MACKKGKKHCAGSTRPHTEIRSEAQRTAMQMANAAMKGKIPVSKLRGPSLEMYKSMKKTGPKSPGAHLEEAKGKKLPEHVVEKRTQKRLNRVFKKRK